VAHYLHIKIFKRKVSLARQKKYDGYLSDLLDVFGFFIDILAMIGF